MQKANKILLLTCVILSALLLVTNFNATGGFRGLITGKYESEDPEEMVDVDFFAMSMCSHCVKFEPVIKDVIDILRENIRFRIFYVLARDQEGVPRSPRGQQEIDENTRQLCINRYYPERLLDYMACVEEHYQDPENVWEACAANNGIETGVIEECLQGEEGEALLEENIKKADYMKITRSPMLMINRRLYTGRHMPNALKDWICDEFENPPEGCAVDLEGTGITGLVIGLPSEEFCTLD